MSEKLLPCPFCGGEAVIERISGSYGYYPAKLRVACLNSTFDKGSKCGCRGVFFGHGEHGYDKTSVAEAKAIAAWNTRAAMQVEAAPVAWLKTWNSVGNARTNMQRVDLTPDCEDWLASMFPTITPLYAHQPVADRVSTSSPVDVGETGNTSSKLRPASVVAHEVCEEMEEYGPSFATKVIEADRQAVRAALVAEIAAWLRGGAGIGASLAHPSVLQAIEAGEWK